MSTLSKLGASKFGEDWALLKLAEESGELSHAALKVLGYKLIKDKVTKLREGESEASNDFKDCINNLLLEISQTMVYIELYVSQNQTGVALMGKAEEVIRHIEDKFSRSWIGYRG